MIVRRLKSLAEVIHACTISALIGTAACSEKVSKADAISVLESCLSGPKEHCHVQGSLDRGQLTGANFITNLTQSEKTAAMTAFRFMTSDGSICAYIQFPTNELTSHSADFYRCEEHCSVRLGIG